MFTECKNLHARQVNWEKISWSKSHEAYPSEDREQDKEALENHPRSILSVRQRNRPKTWGKEILRWEWKAKKNIQVVLAGSQAEKQSPKVQKADGAEEYKEIMDKNFRKLIKDTNTQTQNLNERQAG